MVVKKRQGRIFDVQSYGTRAKSKRVNRAFTGVFLKVLVFLAFALIMSIVSFLGNNWLKIQFIPGNITKTKVTAEIPFEYVSKEKTNRLFDQKKHQSSNVFAVDERSYDDFIRALKLMDEQMENFSYESTLSESGREDIKEFVNEFSSLNVIKLEWQDVALLISSLSPVERAQAFQECVSVLREIAKDGVLSEESTIGADPSKTVNYLGLKLKDGDKRNVRTLEWALHYARMHLMSMDIDNDIANILFNIIKQGIKPNLTYDLDESKAKFDMILKSIKPVRVKIKQGDVILENNAEIDAETYELLSAYQKALKASNNFGYGIHKAFYPKIFMGTMSLLIVTFLMQLLPKNKRPNLRTLASYSTLIIFQLLFLRMFIQLGEYDFLSKNFQFMCSMHFLPPALCASAITMLMYGATGGAAVSFVVSIFYTLMVSKSIEFFIVLFAANLIFLKFLKYVNFRIKIVRASGLTALITTIIVLLKNVYGINPINIIIFQSIFAAIMCVGSGVLTVVMLPIFEKIFSTYSNVTLLELTDYNNPILKNLQVSAPGTYNHSLLVSNIAEQVAMHVNANPVLCKTGALYHDIGKMLKAEYFIENQNNQVNLHDQQTPYISTLVIKNHVKDGIEIAKESKLPPSIIEIIQQHHGTTLIHFFYEKAKRELIDKTETSTMSKEEIDSLITNKIDASAFRYDGPRPRTKESFIIMLADSIEAASRSMKRVTHQAIENLINNIFDTKLNDHQLDECPITFDEIRDMKKAFASTMLAMMHSRISYTVYNNTITNNSSPRQE